MATPLIKTPPEIPQDPPEEGAPAGQAVRTVDSAEILRGSAEIAITHNGRIYRLRHTRNGKLILT